MKKQEKTKTILDDIEERGFARGWRKGLIEEDIERIKMVVSLRFQTSSRRLNTLLTKFNNLTLLEEVCQFALIAPSLPELENFADILAQIKPELKRNLKKWGFEVS